jgi:hypothetical protein
MPMHSTQLASQITLHQAISREWHLFDMGPPYLRTFEWSASYLRLCHIGRDPHIGPIYRIYRAYYKPISVYFRVQKQNVTNHLSESGFEGIIGKLSSRTAQKNLACAFPILKLKLCRRHARIPWQSNIVQHVVFEIGNGFRFAPKRCHGQANKYIYVMVSSTNLPSLYLSFYVVHKLSHAAGYLGHIGLRSEGIFTTQYPPQQQQVTLQSHSH